MPDTNQHIRAQVRGAIAAALVPISETGGRVFQARAWPLEPDDLPCWLIHVDGERIETKQTGRLARQTRTVAVNVVLLCKHSDSVEDEMDDISAQAEELLLSDPAICALTREFTLDATESALNADGSIVVGQTRLAFSATVTTVAGAPRDRA
ncbi:MULTISPECIES: hypothetical protein [unclassified Yoonia]|uniref:hypothetical protein n=1 Tax=unclassified Yoonia TaxID=2629118 RepID=UPI002AFEA40C|nr:MULTISPECIES: hypothetical protein [unclassified Yoonia]